MNQPAPCEEFSDKLCIRQYLHCRLCLEQLPRGKSPEQWSRLSVGMTKQGLQVWCMRHGCNVLHVDYQGQKHPGIFTREAHGHA